MSAAGFLSRFREAYGEHRAAEGRALCAADTLQLPYITSGPQAKQWTVRARTFEAFVSRVLRPLAISLGRAPRLLDVGAGNGWLARRAALEGCSAIALDLREDEVDGLGAAREIARTRGCSFERVVGSFEALPVGTGQIDLVVFNASIHYATNLESTLAEARRVMKGGGRIAVLDTAFYRSARDGEAMVLEKRRTACERFGVLADALMSLDCIEYLTRERLRAASQSFGVTWRRHRVRYPLWYETRPLIAALRGHRAPSRFDVWEGSVA